MMNSCCISRFYYTQRTPVSSRRLLRRENIFHLHILSITLQLRWHVINEHLRSFSSLRRLLVSASRRLFCSAWHSCVTFDEDAIYRLVAHSISL
ncbi:unnamed protein product [Larinioides sclopetarius]|uniref:Uncharacterized protein n=1 Tax=Larinioides sclopetarius TaxID=280406 RepID=A0AAV1ZC99_9ARAC